MKKLLSISLIVCLFVQLLVASVPVAIADTGSASIWSGGAYSTHTVITGDGVGKNSDGALKSVVNEGFTQNRLETTVSIGDGDGQMKPGSVYTISFDVKTDEGKTAVIGGEAYFKGADGKMLSYVAMTLLDAAATVTGEWTHFDMKLGMTVTEAQKLLCTWKRVDMTAEASQELGELAAGDILSTLNLIFYANTSDNLYFDNVKFYTEGQTLSNLPFDNTPSNDDDDDQDDGNQEGDGGSTPTPPPTPTPTPDPLPEGTFVEDDFESPTIDPMWYCFGLSDLSLVAGEGVDGSQAVKSVPAADSGQVRMQTKIAADKMPMDKLYEAKASIKTEAGKQGVFHLILVLDTVEMGSVNVTLETYQIGEKYNDFRATFKITRVFEGAKVEWVDNAYSKKEYLVEADDITVKDYHIMYFTADGLEVGYFDNISVKAVDEYPERPTVSIDTLLDDDFEHSSLDPVWYAFGLSDLTLAPGKGVDGSQAVKSVPAADSGQVRLEAFVEGYKMPLDTYYKATSAIRAEDGKEGLLHLMLIINTVEMGDVTVQLDAYQLTDEWQDYTATFKVVEVFGGATVEWVDNSYAQKTYMIEADELTINGYYMMWFSAGTVNSAYFDNTSLKKVPAFPTAPEFSGPIIPNGTFENGKASPWYSSFSTIEIIEEDGNKSLKATKIAGSEFARVQVKMPAGAFKKGYKYTISGDIRTSSANGGSADMLFVVGTKDHGELTLHLNKAIPVGKDWNTFGNTITYNDINDALEFSYIESDGKVQLWGEEGDVVVQEWYLILLSGSLEDIEIDNIDIVEVGKAETDAGNGDMDEEDGDSVGDNNTAGSDSVDTGDTSLAPVSLAVFLLACGVLLVARREKYEEV